MAKGHTLHQNQPDTDGGVAALSDEQFQTIVDLLTPGYKLSTMMLADYEAQAQKRAEYEASAGYEKETGEPKTSNVPDAPAGNADLV